MSDVPMKLAELNALIQERERLAKRIESFDPPQPKKIPDDSEHDGELPDRKVDDVPAPPSIKVSTGAMRDGYNSGNVLYELSEDASERVRSIALDEWRGRILMIDGMLAGIRGVVV